jgi:hypothetical protein
MKYNIKIRIPISAIEMVDENKEKICGFKMNAVIKIKNPDNTIPI